MVPSSDTFIVLFKEGSTGTVGTQRKNPEISFVNDADFQLGKEEK